MTPRVTQLIEQATEGESFDKEKFAELIVRDVIFVLQTGMPRNGPNSLENTRTKLHMERLIYHFGIKRDYQFIPEGFELGSLGTFTMGQFKWNTDTQ